MSCERGQTGMRKCQTGAREKRCNDACDHPCNEVRSGARAAGAGRGRSRIHLRSSRRLGAHFAMVCFSFWAILKSCRQEPSPFRCGPPRHFSISRGNIANLNPGQSSVPPALVISCKPIVSCWISYFAFDPSITCRCLGASLRNRWYIHGSDVRGSECPSDKPHSTTALT
jgi:hypothetical protein